MRAIFFAAIILAFIAVVYGQTCDTAAATTCLNTYTSCAQSAAGSQDAICTCYGAYGACLTSAGCLSGTAQDTFNTQCQAAGCTAAQCASASTMAASVALILAALAAF